MKKLLSIPLPAKKSISLNNKYTIKREPNEIYLKSPVTIIAIIPITNKKTENQKKKEFKVALNLAN